MKPVVAIAVWLLTVALPQVGRADGLEPHPVLGEDGAVLAPSPGFDMILNAGFSPDGRTVFFTQATKGWAKLQIFSAGVTGDHWSGAVPVPFGDARYRDTDPALSADGRTLLFASDRPLPGADYKPFVYRLWSVSKSADRWGAPAPVAGDAAGPALYPALDDANDLFFMRLAPSGAQIFAARFDGTTVSTAAPLAFPDVTATLDESVSPDGRHLAFIGAEQTDGKVRTKLFLAERDGAAWVAHPLAVEGIMGGPAATGFSRDGRRLYFRATVKTPAMAAAQAGIFYVEIAPG